MSKTTKNKKKKLSLNKILILDIETAPIEALVWGTWQQDVSVEQIKGEWSILSFAAKWLNEPKVFYRSTGGRGKRWVRHDKALLQELWHLLDAADVVIGQNVRRFDLKKINGRMAMHGIPPYSPVRVIDTLEVAKKNFAFTSNRLAWLSKHLTDSPKSEHRRYPGFSLWLECLNDKKGAWSEMKHYNKQDIISTEKVYLALRSWMSNHHNVTATKGACHACGGTDFQKRGWNYAKNHRSRQLSCTGCGSWTHGEKVKYPNANEHLSSC